jgi:TfoX/Sxy family transcriptional regulator of competence genes
MATTPRFVEYVREQSGLGEKLTYRKMFGEYAIYLGGKVVALACDNSLYVKATPAMQQCSVALVMKPPYPGAKPHVIADELLDDPEGLQRFLLATAAALPAPKPKAKLGKTRGN